MGQVLGNGDQLFGMGIRQGMQQHRVHGGKNRNIRADGQGQREEGYQRESRRFRELTESETSVMEHNRIWTHAATKGYRLSQPASRRA